MNFFVSAQGMRAPQKKKPPQEHAALGTVVGFIGWGRRNVFQKRSKPFYVFLFLFFLLFGLFVADLGEEKITAKAIKTEDGEITDRIDDEEDEDASRVQNDQVARKNESEKKQNKTGAKMSLL